MWGNPHENFETKAVTLYGKRFDDATKKPLGQFKMCRWNLKPPPDCGQWNLTFFTQLIFKRSKTGR